MARSGISLMFTRYAWVWLAGVAVGAGAGGAIFAYDLNTQACYTARIPFLVLPPPWAISGSDQRLRTMPADDTDQVIERQISFLEREPFLLKVVASDEFHPQDKPGQETPWLAENKANVLKALRRDLVIVPRVDKATFEITFTSRDPVEAQRLVQAVAKEYLSSLLAEISIRKVQHLKVMVDAVRKAEEAFTIKSTAFMDFNTHQQIDVMKANFEIQKNALQELNEDNSKADAAAVLAQEQVAAFQLRMKSQLELNQTRSLKDGPSTKTPSELENEQKGHIADVLLLPTLKQTIENDITLHTLINTRMSWEREKSAENSKPEANKQRVAEIDARLQEIDTQVEKTHLKLMVDALDRMEKTLTDEAASKRELADYVSEICKRKDDEVNTLGQRLLQEEQRVAELKEQQALLNKMKAQLSLLEANRFTDDTRVQQMIDEPTIPKDPVWPLWQQFVWPGALAGLGLGGIAAAGLALRRKRQDATTIPAV